MNEINETVLKYIEIEINGVPIGYIIINDDGKIKQAEIYQAGLFTKEDFEEALGFLKHIRKYEWGEQKF